jgi:serine protease Do
MRQSPQSKIANRKSQIATALIGLLLLTAVPSLAQLPRAYSPKDSKFSPEVRAAFTLIDPDAVTRARAATVTLKSGQETLAIGTLITSADLPPGIPSLIATKLSQLEAPLTARLLDGRTFAARLLAADADNDLAFISIDDPTLTPETFAATISPIDITDSPNILPPVGKFLATIDPTEASVAGIGVVSTKPRPIPPAIGLLGVFLEDAPDNTAGALVTDVAENSGASAAGMKNGDIITAIDGQAVATRQHLIDLIRATSPGQSVRLQVLRNTEPLDLTATLGSGPIQRSDRAARMNSMGGELSARRLGFQMVIQHDTFLRPNQMGTPLILLDGTPVGLNIARAGRVETYALPLSLVRTSLTKALKSPPPELPTATTRPSTAPTTQP